MFMNNFLSEIQKRVLIYDGSKGVMLQRKGLKGEEAAEFWNVSRPEDVKDVYRAYKTAGSDVLQTNTFPGNRPSLEHYHLADKVYELNYTGVKLAREIAEGSNWVAASSGPTGLMPYPLGELTFDGAYQIFKEQVTAFVDAGTDCVNFETFTNIAEMRAAILAAKENSSLPVIASCSYDAGGKTLFGNPPEVCAVIAQSLGADLVGANCSAGPEGLVEVIKRLHTVATVPLQVKPNAGLPEVVDGKTIFKDTPDQFRQFVKAFCDQGVRLIGGCCGTTPEFIAAIKQEVARLGAVPFETAKEEAYIASPFQLLRMDEAGSHPVGRLKLGEGDLKSALETGDYPMVFDSARDLIFDGAAILYLDFTNFDGKLDIAEFISNFNLNIKVPIVIQSSNAEFLAEFIRYYPGKAGVVQTAGVEGIIEKYGCLGLKPDIWE